MLALVSLYLCDKYSNRVFSDRGRIFTIQAHNSMESEQIGENFFIDKKMSHQTLYVVNSTCKEYSFGRSGMSVM